MLVMNAHTITTIPMFINLLHSHVKRKPAPPLVETWAPPSTADIC